MSDDTDPPLLQPLTGTGLLAFRILWIALFAVALLINTWVAYAAAARDGEAALIRYRAGIHIVSNPSGGYDVTPFSPEARRLGMGNETLLAVDGRAPDRFFPSFMRQLDGAENSRLTLTLQRGDGTRHSVTLTRRLANIDEAYAGSGLDRTNLGWFFYLARSLFGWSLLAVALLLFVRRPSDPVGALLAIGMVVLVSNFGLLWPAERVVFGTIVPAVGWALIMAAMLLFPDARAMRRWTVVGAAAITAYLTVAIGQLWSRLVDDIQPLAFVLVFALVLSALTARYRELPRGTRRQQMKFALLGFAAAAVFQVLAIVLRPTNFHGLGEAANSWLLVSSTLAQSLAGIAFAGGLLVSVLRYRLYDAETAISRSVMFGALTIALLAVFAGSEKVIEILGEEYFGEEMGVLAGGLGAAVAAAMIGPLHHRVSHWAEHRFQGALVHLRQGLPLLLGDLRETATPEALAEVLLERVEHGVRARHGAVLVHGGVLTARDVTMSAVQEWSATWEPGGAQHIDCDRADALFPVRVRLHADGVGQIGWLLLGPRPDGSFYGKDERETLALVADPAARALAITLERQRRAAADRAAWDRLAERDATREREVAALRALVDRLAGQVRPA